MLPAFIFMQSSPFRQCEMTKMASHNIPVCKELNQTVLFKIYLISFLMTMQDPSSKLRFLWLRPVCTHKNCLHRKKTYSFPQLLHKHTLLFLSFALLTSQNSSWVKQQKTIASGNICALSALSGLLHSCQKFLTSIKLNLCAPRNKKPCLYLIIWYTSQTKTNNFFSLE